MHLYLKKYQLLDSLICMLYYTF